MPIHNFARPHGGVTELTVDSAALAGNLLGDPTTRSVGVYLPPGYENGDDDYPLFVDLVGFTGSGFSHLGWKAFAESVPQRLDRLVEEGRMGPVIAVFPDCFTSLGGNQYINSLAMGRWEDFLIDEMIPAVEKRFRVRSGRPHRALFGKSSGGYGAIVHGLRRADAWGAIACHSGDMGFENSYGTELRELPRKLRDYDGDVATFLDRFGKALKVTDEQISILEMLAMAATYDPDPDGPKGIRLPIDLHSGEINDQAWGRWLANDPIELAQRDDYLDNLRSLSGVFIDCGGSDQFRLVYGARQLHTILEAAGVAHRYEEFDDDHSAIDYRMDISLPYLYEAVTSP